VPVEGRTAAIVGRVQVPAQVSPPEFAFTDATPARVIGASAMALPVLAGEDGPELGPGAAEAVDDLGIDVLDLAEALGATGTAGEVHTVPLLPTVTATNPALRSLLLVGVGDVSPASCRRAGAALARAVRGQESVATSVPAVGGPDCLTAFVEGVVLGSFGFSLRTDDDRPPPVRRVVLASTSTVGGGTDEDHAAVLARALALADAGWLARGLATVPANIKSPEWLAGEAVRVAEEAGLDVDVWEEDRLAADGFGGILAVGSGSASPPRFVRLDYEPPGSRRARRRTPRIVLVGKGITFDSGGLNIKPGQSMVTMKRDMTGAAVVLAVLAALGKVGCPVRVTGLLCIAENSIGAAAMRPGDVIRHYGGRTTEVVNTDAEGRLVLADGLAWAVEHLEPDLVVDVATLTGAIKVALGLQTGGLFTTHDALATRLLRAGDDAGEPLWRMPLAEEYADRLSSPVADAINSPTTAQAITAALFLRPFTGGLPWVHLDIASVGDAPEDRYEWTAGPTGFGTRLLLRWLGSPSPLEGVRG
jgi:leucyl aminopeptidase